MTAASSEPAVGNGYGGGTAPRTWAPADFTAAWLVGRRLLGGRSGVATVGRRFRGTEVGPREFASSRAFSIEGASAELGRQGVGYRCGRSPVQVRGFPQGVCRLSSTAKLLRWEFRLPRLSGSRQAPLGLQLCGGQQIPGARFLPAPGSAVPHGSSGFRNRFHQAASASSEGSRRQASPRAGSGSRRGSAGLNCGRVGYLGHPSGDFWGSLSQDLGLLCLAMMGGGLSMVTSTIVICILGVSPLGYSFGHLS